MFIDQDYPYDWLCYYNKINSLLPEITSAASDLGVEAHYNGILTRSDILEIVKSLALVDV